MTEPESAELSRARKAADALARASAALDDPAFWGLKACIGVNLFYWHLDAFETGDDPVLAFIDLCRDAAAILDDSQGGAAGTRVQLQAEQTGERGISTELGALYSTLYSDMTDVEYFQESRQALAGRLTANDIDPRELFGGRIVLDAGCGGGKFTQAIAYFGASRVIGIDIGEGNIAFAREQAKKMSHCAAVEYRTGSILSLPVPDASVDLAWCNSVAHLTGDQGACLRELARVIRRGGTLFYYVNGRFGLFEILLGALRGLMSGVPEGFVRHWLQAMSVPAGRIAWVIACLFAPYEFVPQRRVEEMLHDAGFKRLRQLERGIDIDHSEKIARGEPYARLKYGEGQLRYLAERA